MEHEVKPRDPGHRKATGGCEAEGDFGFLLAGVQPFVGAVIGRRPVICRLPTPFDARRNASRY